MMLFKLAFKNMKKSIKDYSIYFFTLVFAVAIFYIFNSLDSQTAMLEMIGCKNKTIEILIMALNYVSVLVSIILGFLIIYANNFLIKRRKKEIGLYLTLGMKKRDVSKILVIETILIGIISLIVGLVLGIGLSQLLSAGAIKLFTVDISEYKFVFSQSACIKTSIYFAIIFILVMLFNVFILNKYKLIDLLYGAKKNEKIRLKNKFLVFLIFALAIGTLGYAYYLLFHGALQELNNKFAIMLVCGCLGTFLFFLSSSGFMLKIIEMNKKIYYKGLNMFVLKQVNSKINTTVFSTTIISILLLFTIGILACSLSLATVYNNALDKNNLSDFTLKDTYIRYVYDENNNAIRQTNKFDIDSLIKSDKYNSIVEKDVKIQKYTIDTINAHSLLSDNAIERAKKNFGENLELDIPIDIIKKSDFDNLMRLYGREDLIIDYDDNFMFTCNVESLEDYYKDNINDNIGININGKKYTALNNKIYNISIENSNGDMNAGIIIVPDKALEGIEPSMTEVMGNFYKDLDNDSTASELEEYINSIDNNANVLLTKSEMIESSMSIKVLVVFVGLYLGIIFAITSATILAIQQLSESSDNIERYKVLRQIGADQKMINKSLFSQIGICFMIPLAVGIFHAYFGLKQTNQILKLLGNLNMETNILITAAFIILVYGGYFLATYLCSKKIISEE